MQYCVHFTFVLRVQQGFINVAEGAGEEDCGQCTANKSVLIIFVCYILEFDFFAY